MMNRLQRYTPPASADQIAEAEGAIRAFVFALKCHGLVLTVEQRSVPPLAMGRYETVVSVRKARNAQ